MRMTNRLQSAAHRVRVARDDVTACLADRDRLERAAEVVETFRAACEVLDLEQQLHTGRRLRPEEALELASRLSRSDLGGVG